MQERVFNLFVFVASEYIGELGVVVHEIDGFDSDKLNFLRTVVESDAGAARRFAIPLRYTRRLSDSVSVPGLHSSVFEQMIYGGRGLEVFEDVLDELNAPPSPLVCITHVVDGVVRIDKVHDLVEPSQPLRAVLVDRFAMPDYVTLYLTDDGFDLARLLNDDYFRAIKLLYQERLFVSAAKLLMSFIDTVAYLNEGDCQGNFQRWLDMYVATPSLRITADELRSDRGSPRGRRDRRRK
jgi:hypothetical protein